MSNDENTKTFRVPNLESDSTSKEAFIGVRGDRTQVSISEAATERIGADPGKYLRLVLDRTGTPWVGIVEERTKQQEPVVANDGTTLVAHSTLMARHLMNAVDDIPDGAFRLYFTGETARDTEADTTVHQLTRRS